MKRIIYVISIFLLSCNICAQTLDDINRLSINVQRPNSKTIPIEAVNLLEDKMHQIITLNGISDNSINRRFIITAAINVIKKDITTTSPARVVQTLDITFYIKDIIDHKEYGNTTISTTGVGLNENKSFIMAFNNIKPNNSRIQKMIDECKALILTYYRTNIDKIISESEHLAQQGLFDKALFILAQVPDICSECTEKCQKVTIDIYYNKIDSEGLYLLQQAKASWASSPNSKGANEAAKFLSQIHFLASCQEEVNFLIKEITEKIKEDEQKAWEFELQKYNDAKIKEQRDFEFRVRQYEEREAKEQARYEYEVAKEQRDFEFETHRFNKEHEKNMAIISASREVALEFAKQKPNINN